MRIGCWIPKATNTHSEYVISIAIQRLQWLRERAECCIYTKFTCLVNKHFLR